MTRLLSDLAIKAAFIKHMWREAMPEDRVIYAFLFAQILFSIYLLWSLA